MLALQRTYWALNPQLKVDGTPSFDWIKTWHVCYGYWTSNNNNKNKQALVPQYLGLTMDSQQTNQTNEHSKMVETF